MVRLPFAWNCAVRLCPGVAVEQDVAGGGASGILHLDHTSPAGGVGGGAEFGEAVAVAGAAGGDEFGVWRRSSNEKLGSAVGPGFAWEGQRAGEEAEVAAGPELDERDERAAGGEVVAGEGPAGVEVAHKIAAGRAGPGDDLEGAWGQPVDVVRL